MAACAPPTYTIGGTVFGLAGTGLVLQNNGGDNLALTASGAFVFERRQESGSSYSVELITDPAALICTVENGSGTIDDADITNVVVRCVRFISSETESNGTVGTADGPLGNNQNVSGPPGSIDP